MNTHKNKFDKVTLLSPDSSGTTHTAAYVGQQRDGIFKLMRKGWEVYRWWTVEEVEIDGAHTARIVADSQNEDLPNPADYDRHVARMSGYTDEALDKMAESDMPGPRNRVAHLRTLDTPYRRARASSEGMTLTNLMGGRPSDNLGRAVRSLLDLINADREDEELYGERTAREYRERENARREADPRSWEREMNAAMGRL